MIPIRDHNPTLRTPIVTRALIAINIVVFIAQLVMQSRGISLIDHYGVIPSVISAHSGTGTLHSMVWLTPFSSMFLHGGVVHLLGNLWFLHIFGDNVEDALGRLRFLLFYLAAGGCAVFAQVVINPDSQIPMIGASGAISGVLAGYLLLYPRARIVTLVPIFIFLHFVELRAFLFIFIWFGLQLFYAYIALGNISQDAGGVAWFAHLGGFFAGLIGVRVLGTRKIKRTLSKRR